ncbi:hypothetical protein BV22DRAFT_1125008 [Leucogyrophana mollusca]|uniref:Uncharacterized protein n=1 Tax=Leucogyrophana mollusca TaxID=85980 RepID=A0ACB8BWI0_9AGAM|nr:hypothetical protein BV22DRAFT_1125008 [Leucogyrophana mollusca]
MDHTTFDVSDKTQESNMAAKQRFESFKLGGGVVPPPCVPHNLSKHSHGRSRSRNTSITSLSSLSLSASVPSLPSSNDFSSNAVLSNGPSKRPNSHHRRRSSVSTRRESAELMGVSIPDLPAAHSDDNVNFGDKDSIRRRALWALEGKPDLAFSKVEIPDMSTPDLSKTGYEFPTKPSFPAGSGFSGGLNGLMGKRDSFGKLLASSSSSKDQLHTLVEEEEEEEEDPQVTVIIEEQVEAPVPEVSVPMKAPFAKSPSKPRPKSLNLRPLSLCAGTVVNCGPGNLPTPTLTPSPRPHGLRALALTPNSDFSSMNTDSTNSSSTTYMTRQSVTPSPTGFFGAFARRSSFSFQSDSPSPCDVGAKRRSSISYKRSDSTSRDMGVLPTPEMTPTERRFSETSDNGSLVEQPLTASEQHFLFKSHNVLLSRITDLERALRSRSSSRSRPVSVVSDASASSEPSDEMLQLISDLKAERDELKKDVDGWRMRVADADKQTSVLAKRIESERREAWVARSRLGLLEVEKGGLEKLLSEKSADLEQALSQNDELKRDRAGMKDEIDKLNARLKDAEAAVDECLRLRAALDEEKSRRGELEKLLDESGLLTTPTLPQSFNGQAKGMLPTRSLAARRGLGFQSVDSESSSTDVESVDDSFNKAEWTLNAVAEEEEEDTCDMSDEEDGLAGYEDEEDSDISFQSPGGSSIGSEDELDAGEALPRSGAFPSPPIPPRPSHAQRASLSKTWTFPRGQSVPSIRHEADEIDRFFGCLDDLDNSPPMGSFGAADDMGKALFSSSFGPGEDDEDDELPPFLLPSDVGVVVEVPTSRSLDVVPEEDEEEEETEGADDADDEDELFGEEVEGGIRFTFNVPSICVTPPPTICITPPADTERLPALSVTRKPVPVYEPFDENEDDEPFTFHQTKAQEPVDTLVEDVSPSPSSPVPESASSERPSSRSASSPSSIPRSTALRSFASVTPLASSTPPRTTPTRVAVPSSPTVNSFITPPSRRGGTMPSFIPQPISSPSPSKYSTPSKTRSSLPVLRSKQGSITSHNGSTFKPQLKLSMSTPNSFASSILQPTTRRTLPDAQISRRSTRT